MTQAQIIEERLKKFEHWSLKLGAHSPDSTFCVMEAVAYVAGEEWSDHPECACPVISTFLRSWNDALPNDAERARLLEPLAASWIKIDFRDPSRDTYLLLGGQLEAAIRDAGKGPSDG